MKLYELLKINSLEKNIFLKFILAVQFTILFIIGLDAIGLNIPILRQLIGFIYLTFIPGILIFRILKIHEFDLINILLFTVGLSITFLMLCGLFINILYPIIGISNPLSILSLTATTCVFISIFSIIIYYRDEDIIEINTNKKYFFKPSILLPIIILLPASFWNSSIHDNVNAMLSIVILPIFYSHFIININNFDHNNFICSIRQISFKGSLSICNIYDKYFIIIYDVLN